MTIKKRNTRNLLLTLGVSFCLVSGYMEKPVKAQENSTTLQRNQDQNQSRRKRRVKQVRSKRGGDATFIEDFFTLVETDSEGNPIEDIDGNNEVGYFPGAIADFVDGFIVIGADERSSLNPEEVFGVMNVALDTDDFGRQTRPIISNFGSFEALLDAIENKGLKAKNMEPLDLRVAETTNDGIRYDFIDSALSAPEQSVFNILVSSSDIRQAGLSPETDLQRLTNDLPFIIQNFNWVTRNDLSLVTTQFISEGTFSEDLSTPQATPEPGILLGLLSLVAGSSKLVTASRKSSNQSEQTTSSSKT